MNKQTILISLGVVAILIILVVVIVLRKKEKFTGNNVASAVLTTDSNGNISVADSLVLNSAIVNTLDVDNGLTLNQSAGNQGYVMTSTGSGSNPVWQPGFMRFVGVFPTTISNSTINSGQTMVSTNLTGLTPGKTLLVKADMGVYSGGGGTASIKATLSGGDTSNTFYVQTNGGAYTTLNFTSTIKNANSGSTTVLSIINTWSSAIFLYPNSTATITVYEIQ